MVEQGRLALALSQEISLVRHCCRLRDYFDVCDCCDAFKAICI